jgi:hypothetical protein
MRLLRVLCFPPLLILSASCLPHATAAQESSSRSNSSSFANIEGQTPSAALSNVLSAACSHDEQNFRKFLTIRDQQAFSQLTQAARVKLMRRFVLLTDAGTRSVTTTPEGLPIIHCQTIAGTAEIDIGKADLRDNLAFLPVALHDASNSNPADAQHVLMGLVRENGQWKVLSIGLLLLDLPSLEVEWNREESAQNEQAALDALKSLAAAIETYRRTYTHLPESLAQLGPPPKGTPGPETAGFVDSELASGNKNGYSFRYVIVGASDVGAPAKYELSATPAQYGVAGKLSFFRDSGGVYHAGDHHGAVGVVMDPVVQ